MTLNAYLLFFNSMVNDFVFRISAAIPNHDNQDHFVKDFD